MKLPKKLRRPPNVAVVDLGTHSVKVAVVDLTAFSPSVVGFGKEAYPENTIFSGLVSSWEGFTKTVVGALRQASLSGGFTPSEISYSLSGEFIKSLTLELSIHRIKDGPIEKGEREKLEKEMDRLVKIEVEREFTKITGLPGNEFKIVEKTLVGAALPRGVLVESLGGVLETDFVASLNVSFISEQSFNLLKKLSQDLKKSWAVSFDQTATIVSLLKKKEPQISGVFLDIGGQVCDLALVSRGRILGERTLPLGGRDVTQITAENSVAGSSLLESYGQFFCESLEAILADLLEKETLPNWPIYFWGGGAKDDWWAKPLTAHLARFPDSRLKNLVWQKLTEKDFELSVSEGIEKPLDFEPLLAVCSQLPQKYAAD